MLGLEADPRFQKGTAMLAQQPRDYGVPLLLLLSATTGLVDAASVLGLGRVFTANMTGNVVFLGFAAAGLPGFAWLSFVVAIAAFMLGAVAGGRTYRRYIGRAIMSTSPRPAAGWEDQRAFLAVIEEGSLSAAARRLGLSQPTVRARVAALEQALGGALFVRSVGGMVPTSQALTLADHARAMRRASEAMMRAASSPPGEIAGTVRLSASEFVGIEVLAVMLASLRGRHPDIRVELVLSNAIANLLEQEVDVAVRTTDPRQQALVARKVARIPLGLFAHRGYLARRGMPEALADLSRHDVIGPDRTQADLALAAPLLAHLAPGGFALRTDSHPAQFAAARAGLGIAAVQVPVAEACADLVHVLPKIRIGLLETWVVTHEDLRHVPRVRAVLEHLSSAFAGQFSR